MSQQHPSQLSPREQQPSGQPSAGHQPAPQQWPTRPQPQEAQQNSGPTQLVNPRGMGQPSPAGSHQPQQVRLGLIIASIVVVIAVIVGIGLITSNNGLRPPADGPGQFPNGVWAGDLQGLQLDVSTALPDSFWPTDSYVGGVSPTSVRGSVVALSPNLRIAATLTGWDGDMFDAISGIEVATGREVWKLNKDGINCSITNAARFAYCQIPGEPGIHQINVVTSEDHLIAPDVAATAPVAQLAGSVDGQLIFSQLNPDPAKPDTFRLFAVDPSSGVVQWDYLWDGKNPDPQLCRQVGDDMISCATQDEMIFIDARTGDVKWQLGKDYTAGMPNPENNVLPLCDAVVILDGQTGKATGYDYSGVKLASDLNSLLVEPLLRPRSLVASATMPCFTWENYQRLSSETAGSKTLQGLSINANGAAVTGFDPASNSVRFVDTDVAAYTGFATQLPTSSGSALFIADDSGPGQTKLIDTEGQQLQIQNGGPDLPQVSQGVLIWRSNDAGSVVLMPGQ